MRVTHALPVLLIALLITRALAAPVSPESNDAVYHHALYSLQNGHGYERAIQQLQYLTARDGKNRAYHLALGCADADRAASLGYTAMWAKTLADDRAQYPAKLAEWEAAQRDPKSDDYGHPRPDPPPDRTFITKDDAHPFLISLPQAVTRINALSKSAQAEWKLALALSRTSAERAEAQYVRGWGIHLLRLVTQGSISNGVSSALPGLAGLPKDVESVKAFASAVKDAPDNAAYWESLGDALRADPVDQLRLDFLAPQYAAMSAKSPLAAYQKALALQPRNAALWFRVYQIYSHDRTGHTPQKEDALQHMIDSDPDNAYPHYLLAGIRFRETHYSDPHDKQEEVDQKLALTATYDAAQQKAGDAALTQMEQGNAAAHYFQPQYEPPYPTLLSGFGIWRSMLIVEDVVFGENGKMREMARAAGGYSRIAAAHGDPDGAERGARAAIGIGLQMVGDWPTKDAMPGSGELINALVGFAVVGISYSDLIKGREQLKDTLATQQARAEYDALLTRENAWREVVRAHLADASEYDYF